MAVVVRSLRQGPAVTADPNSVVWLSRALLSGNFDVKLHRDDRCPGVRFAGGAWQLFSRDKNHTLYVANRDDLPNLTADRATNAERIVQAARVTVAWGDEYLLENGVWLVSLRGWNASIEVRGIIRRPVDPGPGTPGGDLTALGPVPYKPPQNPAHYQEALSYLGLNGTDKSGRGQQRRLTLAYHYREYVLRIQGAKAISQLDVSIAMCEHSVRAVEIYTTQLRRLIWPRGSGTSRDLLRYLLHNDLITRTTVFQADRRAEENRRSGESDRTAQRFGYRRGG
jgi:hypothetical protein